MDPQNQRTTHDMELEPPPRKRIRLDSPAVPRNDQAHPDDPHQPDANRWHESIWRKEATGGVYVALISPDDTGGFPFTECAKNEEAAKKCLDPEPSKTKNRSGDYRDRIDVCHRALGLSTAPQTRRRCYEQNAHSFKKLKLRSPCIQSMRYYRENAASAVDRPHFHASTGSDAIQWSAGKWSCSSALPFRPKPEYPWMERRLLIRRNSVWGRHIVAAERFNAGERVFSELPFAWAAENPAANEPLTPYCMTCGAADSALIPCAWCPNAFYCTLKCQTVNKSHAYECGTSYHTAAHINVYAKAIAQMVLECLATFGGDFDRLQQAVHEPRTVSSGGGGGTPAITSLEAKCKLALSLEPKYQTESGAEWGKHALRRAYDVVLGLPKVHTIFGGEIAKRRWLQHLLAHCMGILKNNCFRVCIRADQHAIGLYAGVALFNHSCSPSIGQATDGVRMYGYTTQAIGPGQQVFIAYDPGLLTMTKAERQDIISERWQFECGCARCNWETGATSTIGFNDKCPASLADLEAKLNVVGQWTPTFDAYVRRYEQQIVHFPK